MSFVNATLVLSIGETVEEVTDSGFLGTTPTLSCSALGDDALVQVGQLPAHIELISRPRVMKARVFDLGSFLPMYSCAQAFVIRLWSPST